MPAELSAKVLRVIEKYGSGLNFATVFNPALQSTCASNLKQTFTGDAPTLAVVGQTYPSEQVNTWIMAHLVNLYKFAGVKEKLDMFQMEELAMIIRTEYYYFKASELLLFFHKLKSGEYGVFYGAVDPMVITGSLLKFKNYRSQQIDIYERERQRIRRENQLEEWNKNAVPCPEHLSVAKQYVEETNNHM